MYQNLESECLVAMHKHALTLRQKAEASNHDHAVSVNSFEPGGGMAFGLSRKEFERELGELMLRHGVQHVIAVHTGVAEARTDQWEDIASQECA